MYESFATVWEAIADAIPDATAVVQGERRVRWRELEDHAARLAAGLAAEGIGAGAHVALFLFNCPEYMECLFACSKLRALSANVNFRYEAGELAALLENADAEVLVFHRSLGERVAAVRDRLPKLRMLIEIDDGGDARRPVAGAIAVRRAARGQRAAPPHRALGRRPAALVHGWHHRLAEGRALAPGHAAQLRRGRMPPA